MIGWYIKSRWDTILEFCMNFYLTPRPSLCLLYTNPERIEASIKHSQTYYVQTYIKAIGMPPRKKTLENYLYAMPYSRHNYHSIKSIHINHDYLIPYSWLKDHWHYRQKANCFKVNPLSQIIFEKDNSISYHDILFEIKSVIQTLSHFYFPKSRIV